MKFRERFSTVVLASGLFYCGPNSNPTTTFSSLFPSLDLLLVNQITSYEVGSYVILWMLTNHENVVLKESLSMHDQWPSKQIVNAIWNPLDLPQKIYIFLIYNIFNLFCKLINGMLLI